MAHIVFYEKPGCQGNLRQRTLLQEAGHKVEIRNLKTEPWTAEKLLDFLAGLPVKDWFNPSATRVKSGEIDAASLNEQEAIALMLADPLLIRRPLLVVNNVKKVGFDVETIKAWIGLDNISLPSEDLSGCVHGPGAHQCSEPLMSQSNG